MTRTEYTRQRKARGTQSEVAKILGVTRATINRRETGQTTITPEAALAMKCLPLPPAPPLQSNPPV